MLRFVILVGLCGLSTLVFAEEPISQLPTPHYQRQASDPQWMADVVQFHGHLGPAVIAGARVGMAGLRAVDAKGFFDIDVTCEGPMVKPPQSCFLDGLQVATGATLGKRSLHWVEADQIIVRFKNTKTGKTADLLLTPALVDLVPTLARKPKGEKDHDHAADKQAADKQAAEERSEAISRQIAAMPAKELVTVATDNSQTLR
jgi:formylmethanofuran dehydrogenase subunit E